AGEMAILVRCRYKGPDQGLIGTLARIPPSGGAPRELAENVISADWTLDGQNLALIRLIGNVSRVEFPLGKVLYETSNVIRDVRVSPKGNLLAFLEFGNLGNALVTIDMNGKKNILSAGWGYMWGVAWSRSGDEVLFGAGKSMLLAKELHSVTLSGKERLIFR